MLVWLRQTQIKKKILKRNIVLEQSVRKILEGLNELHGTNLILISDVDQDTKMFGLHEKSRTYEAHRGGLCSLYP